MKTLHFDLTASDSTTLRGTAWLPQGAARAVVVIVHGMAEHGARYARFGETLVSSGYAVYAADQRGHGRTAEGATLGHFADEDGWARVTEDVDSVVSFAADRHPGAPIALFGHSMGSLVARTYAARHGARLAALVLSGTAADAGALGRVGQTLARLQGRLRGVDHESRLLNNLTFGPYNKAFEPTRTDFDWLSRDDAAVDTYIADEKCGFVCTASFYDDMLGGLRLVNTPPFVATTPPSLPVLIVSGGADPVGGNGKGVRSVAALLRAAGVEDVTTMLYAGARHELLHETIRDEVAADIGDWLNERITPAV